MVTRLAIVLLLGLASAGSPLAAESSDFLVKDIHPSGSSGPTWLRNIGGILHFQAEDGTSGVEPWRSDGTQAGTFLIHDIWPGPAGSYPSAFSGLDGTVYFAANNGALGSELWQTTGASGAALVEDLNPGPADSWPGVGSQYTRVGGALFFMAYSNPAGYELWRTAGSPATTELVRDINPGIEGSTPLGLIDLNGELVFRADDGLPATNHRELWRSDGTANGTAILEDLNPTGEGYPSNFVLLNGVLFFTANDGTHGEEIWQSDGTPEGTELFRDLNPTGSALPAQLRRSNGSLYFVANDGVHGTELWKSDGTPAGTEMVVDLNPTGSSPISYLTVAGDRLYFVRMAAAFNHQLWTSDGTAAGTVMLKGFTPSNYHPMVENLTDMDGTLYFTANDGEHGVELWKSDGTIAGTVLAADIWPGDAWSFSWPKDLTPVAGTLYFSADDGVHGRELCAVHGATAGVGGVAGAGALSTLRLLPAAPNPFRGVTALRFDLDAPAAVRVRIFDVAGHLVREILPGDRLAAGRHAIDWDGRNAGGRDLASGVYVYQVEFAARREVGRVVLAR